MKNLFIISTNETWGGSEELWSRAIEYLDTVGITVTYTVPYEHPSLHLLKARRVPYFYRSAFGSPLRRGLFALGLLKNRKYNRRLVSQLRLASPDLVIIAQGHNVISSDVLDACWEVGARYLTVTQLVSFHHYPLILSGNFDLIRRGYLGAIRNFFVSRQNLEMNNGMLALNLGNAEVIFNPCKVRGKQMFPFPGSMDTTNIAMVGRLECFHKGFDLALQVMCLPQWRGRNIRLNIYGVGQHLDVLKAFIDLNKLTNVRLIGHTNAVEEVWRDNHILLLASRIEGQSLALIEAMWCARPAIVTDVGGALELIEDGVNGFVADATTVKSIDQAMEKAWERRDDWEVMGKAAAEAIIVKHPPDEVAYFCAKIQNLLA